MILNPILYPPLTGGIIATSSPGLICPSCISTYSRFTAMATDDSIFLSFNLECLDSRIRKSSSIEIEADDSGNGMFSVDSPAASFADAK